MNEVKDDSGAEFTDVLEQQRRQERAAQQAQLEREQRTADQIAQALTRRTKRAAADS